MHSLYTSNINKKIRYLENTLQKVIIIKNKLKLAKLLLNLMITKFKHKIVNVYYLKFFFTILSYFDFGYFFKKMISLPHHFLRQIKKKHNEKDHHWLIILLL